MEVDFTTTINGALQASEYRLTSIYKLCMAGIDYFNAKGYNKVNISFDLNSEDILEVIIVASEQLVTSSEDEIIRYKHSTFEARILMMKAENVFFTNSGNLAKFTILLKDDAKCIEVQNYTKALRDKKARENTKNFEN